MMKRLINLLVIIGIYLLLPAVQADQSFTIHNSQFTIHNSFDLQAAINAAQPGDVIRVPGGAYSGNFLIEKPLTLEGIDWPVLDGQNQGNVIEINDAPGVTIRGFVIRNSGARLEKENAGIAVDKSPRLTVENNRLENTLFGVYIKESEYSRIANNVIGAKDLDAPARGDGIRVWYSQNSEVVGNRVDKGRDVVLWYNNNSIIRDNVITNGRYGLHFMYCDDNLVENNYVSGNSVGAFLMYSRRLTLQHNVFSHNRGPSGYGIGLKDMDGVEATNNLFSSNRVGMYFDNSPWSVDVNQHFSHNAFVHNDIGLLFTPSVKRNYFSQNSFIDNLEQVALTGSGTFKDNFFTVDAVGNFWSDYAGYDEGGDGIGDLAYESKSLFENMMDANPPLRMFQLSPAQQAVDLAARAFPIFQPKPKFVDEAPLMTPVQPAIILPESGSPWPIWALAGGLALLVGMIILIGVTTMNVQETKRQPPPTSGEPMIKVAGLTKQFGNFTAVDEVSFEVAPGQSVALWGANGAGKTTIIRCILGLLSGQGMLWVNGYDARKAGKKARAAIGYVPQELAFHDDLSARDTLRFYAQLKHASNDRIEAVLAEVGLSDQGDKLVGALSGGMKQRLALALALLADPPILLLDEPTSSLDTKAREDFIKLLLKQKSEGKTLLLTSHRLEEVTTLADQVLVLAQGKLVQTCHRPTDLADQLGMQSSLKLIVPEAARAIALNLLLAQGFSARLNGAGLRVDVSPNAKTAPLRALLAENIEVHNFEVDNGH
jgi:nitrous oxidase accessory protein